MRALVFAVVLLNIVACEDKSPSPTDVLTGNEWGKPEVIHHPPFGYNTITSCDEASIFHSDGSYGYTNFCRPELALTGVWIWTEKGKEIRLETYFGDIPQHTYKITILALTNDLFHIIQIAESDEQNDSMYWELKYYPK